MSEGYTGPRWQLYAFDSHFPYRYHKNIPTRIKDQVCLCLKWEGFNLDETRKSFGFPICKKCNKQMHYSIHKCIGCGEIFLKNFKHTNFCPLDPLCWNCCEEVASLAPEIKCKHLQERTFDSRIQEPLVKVRKFTADELEGIDGIEDFHF